MSGESQQLNVRDVKLNHDTLTWTSCDDDRQQGRVLVEEILFTLVPPHSAQTPLRFIICCLRERPEEKATPFQLLMLAAESVPDQLTENFCVRKVPSYLCCDNGNRVDVVVSTKSGLGLSLPFWETILRPLLDLAHDVMGTLAKTVEMEIITQSSHSVRQYAHSLRRVLETERRSTNILLLSGDGGVADLLNGYQGSSEASRLLITLLPLGTGNALFHSLHKPISPSSGPSRLVLSLRTLFHGVSVDLPVFRASFSPGARIVSHTENGALAREANANPDLARHDTGVSHLHGAIVASYGFHATLVYESDTPEYRIHGDKRFRMVAEELLRLSHPYKATLRTRKPSHPHLERDIHPAHAYILVAAVSNLERTFTISPASRPLDGKLFLVHFGPVGGERTMDVITKAYDSGKHVAVTWDDGEAVRYDEVDEVVVEVTEDDERWRKICIDGTIVEVPIGGSMTVSKAQKKPFQILVHTRVAIPSDSQS